MKMSFVLLFATLVMTNVADVSSALIDNNQGAPFELTGMITSPNDDDNTSFSFVDDSGGIICRNFSESCTQNVYRAGDTVKVKGEIGLNPIGRPIVKCFSIDLLSHDTPPPPLTLNATEFLSGSADGKLVRLDGTVLEVFKDEIDTRWIYVSLNCDNTPIFAILLNRTNSYEQIYALTDAKVSICGICTPLDDGLRKITGRMIFAKSPLAFSVLQSAPTNLFASPLLQQTPRIHPREVTSLGKRRIIGKVIAIWEKKNILLIDAYGDVHRVRFDTENTPRYGDVIETVGMPETDLYRINLSNALWKESSADISYNGTPCNVSVRDIFLDKNGANQINPTYHGRAVNIQGTVIDESTHGNRQTVITLKSDGFSIPVDVSNCYNALGPLETGTTLSVSGTCVILTDNWHPFGAFPHITGIMLIVRDPSDVVIHSRPPWWSAGKLMLLAGAMLILLIAFAIWNRWLNRLVSRRSRALVKEQLALAEAELKIGERTRLAIELHDSLSQNLAAVACQVAATKSAVKVNADETMENLNTAERILLSCRTELRRCLWDLRNDALDEQNMTDVIQKVLAPVLGKAKLQIRFNVARTRLDDSTLHTVICIIRELTANAVVHGQATNVTVAGDLDGETLAFSVNENGKGFDPGTCDGPAEGHFGLAGIRERIERLRGTFTLKSHPRKGSYTKITFRLPSNDVED